MRLYFVRHGHSANNLLRLDDTQGRNEDPQLTELGNKQIQILAQYLASNNKTHEAPNDDAFTITHIYTSPMLRAMDTAKTIAQNLGIQPAVWEELHEVGGIWLVDGKTGERIGQSGHDRAFFVQGYPEFILPDHWADNGWWNRPYEQPQERRTRADRFIETLYQKHGDTNHGVLVVSHRGFYNCFLKSLLKLPVPDLDLTIYFDITNAGITHLDFSDHRVRIAYQNRAHFLAKGLAASLLDRV